MTRTPHLTARFFARGFRIAFLAALTAGAILPVHADRVVQSWSGYFIPPDGVARQQIPLDTAVDSRGNVAICGYLNNGTTSETFFVAKYDGLHGNVTWFYILPGQSADSRATSVAFDSLGNVVATGWNTTSNGRDYVTVKLASATGADLWGGPRGYNNTGTDGQDQASRIVVDSDNAVIVTGRSSNSGTNSDIYTIKYSSVGNVVWAVRYNYFDAILGGNRDDFAEALAVDGDDNVIVGGTADNNGQTLFYTGKIQKTSPTSVGVTLWDRTFVSGKFGVRGVAVDKSNNVIVTGLRRHLNTVDTDLFTIKYNAAGAQQWTQTYYTEDPSNIGLTELSMPYWAGVGVDAAGDVYVATTSQAQTPDGELQKRRIYVAKYDTDSQGALLWDEYSVPRKVRDGTSTLEGSEDIATGIAVDPSGNVVVIGTSDSPLDSQQREFYIARYSSEGGDPTAEYRLNGDDEGGSDVPSAVALDRNCGIAITGLSRKPTEPGQIKFPGAATVKLNRFLAVTGDPVAGDDLSDKAKLGSLFTPAIANNGEVAARVTVVDGKKKLGAILFQGRDGLQGLVAIQNAAAPGITGAKFKSFFDPILTQTGPLDQDARLAFIAKLSGVPSDEGTAIFAKLGVEPLTKVLQTGDSIPTLPTGVVVKSISRISARSTTITGGITAVVTLEGPEVSKANNSLLANISLAGVVSPLIRTGDAITADSVDTTVKSITVLDPAKGSPGHGRSKSNTRVVTRLGLADGRTSIVAVTDAGLKTVLLTSGQAADVIETGATWKSFGVPATGLTNRAAFLATASGDGVNKSNDSAILSTTNNTSFSVVAAEGGDATGAGSAKYGALSDPVVSLSNETLAFVAGLTGQDVSKKNNSGVWFGPFATPTLIARKGDDATDTAGQPGDTPWTSFTSLALPSGSTAGPVFIAKVAGKKNNTGLWGLDSGGILRQLIRTGDLVDQATGDSVSGFSLLQSTAGSSGAVRSYNDTGAFGVLLKLKKSKSQAIYYMGIP
jgi:hypothetical protein